MLSTEGMPDYHPSLSIEAYQGTFKEQLGEKIRQWFLFPTLHYFLSLETYGLDNLDIEGTYVFVANHSSHLDTLVLLASLPQSSRLKLRVAAATDYFFTNPFKGRLVELICNAFSFERKGGTHSRKSLDVARDLLAQGKSILIFPEGTRSRDGQLQPLKHGGARLALASHVPVVPIWIDGTFAALPKGRHWPHHRRIVVKFGTPRKFSSRSDPRQVTREIEQSLRQLVLEYTDTQGRMGGNEQ